MQHLGKPVAQKLARNFNLFQDLIGTWGKWSKVVSETTEGKESFPSKTEESSNDGSDLLEPAMWKRLGRLEAENTVSPSTTSSKYLLTSTVT
jgi:hypothetical protein